MATPAVTDNEIENVLGVFTGIRGPTLEEDASLVADFLSDLADDATRPGRRRRRVSLSPAFARHVAGMLYALATVAVHGG